MFPFAHNTPFNRVLLFLFFYKSNFNIVSIYDKGNTNLISYLWTHNYKENSIFLRGEIFSNIKYTEKNYRENKKYKNKLFFSHTI